MLTGFLLFLRAHGLKVSLPEQLTLLEALSKGYARASLSVFYGLARALLVKRESQLDLFDRCFAEYFGGIEGQRELSAELLDWLKDPQQALQLSDEERALLAAMDLETLREEFEKRLHEQKERHDGGNKWIGTGGTSPFGHGGNNPAGVRVGGSGGGRSAVQVASDRRFQNLRSDQVLDTRQVSVALRRLRRLAKDGAATELDVDATIDKSAKEGGEIELVFSAPRHNRVKLLLLTDVGGSMDPHARVCEQLFSAAHQASHFKAFDAYFFHNCPYGRLYQDIWEGQGPQTSEVLKKIDHTWTVVFVGDAWMSPYELTHQSGAISYWEQNPVTGLEWLKRFTEKTDKTAWLNPESRAVWEAPSVRLVRSLFPMFPLTLDGLTEAVDHLRGVRKQKRG
jgi:uncharacterized protein